MLHCWLFPERQAQYYGLNDSVSLSAVLPWKYSSSHPQRQPESLVLGALASSAPKRSGCGHPLTQRGGRSETWSPLLTISTLLLLTWILPLSLHMHVVQAFDLLAVTRTLAERAMGFRFVLCLPKFLSQKFSIL